MINSILKSSFMQSLPKFHSIMKKRSRPISPSPSTPPPSSPPPLKSKPISNSFKNPKRTLLTSPNWIPLNISKSELFLPLTFPTGQTFRWKQTGPLQFTGVVGSHLVSLKNLENGDIAACFHNSKDDLFDAKLVLLDFLNVGICLSELWEVFSGSDSRFSQLAPYLGGARVLRQDPLECLVQFICSSNNNIKRITQMVDFVSSLGVYLGTVEGFRFYEFPTLDRLSDVSEEELRVAGFGYRAKYITGTVDALRAKPGGGVEWLASLRDLDLQMAINALTTLPGVGPKVAACVALFSLDQHHAIPVDTHVWQSLLAPALHLSYMVEWPRHLSANMGSMLVGPKHFFLLQNCLLKKHFYHLSCGLPQKRNLPRQEKPRNVWKIFSLNFKGDRENIYW